MMQRRQVPEPRHDHRHHRYSSIAKVHDDRLFDFGIWGKEIRLGWNGVFLLSGDRLASATPLP